MSEYRYCRGSERDSEVVEFDILENGNYETTCIVNVKLLLYGIRKHPCGNGDDVVLDDQRFQEVLEVVKKERDAIRYNDKPKTLDGWCGSGLDLDEYLFVGCEVDEDIVGQQLNSLPPRSHRAGYVQTGEPYDHVLDERDDSGKYRAVYSTFHRVSVDDRIFWVYAGHCFAGDYVDKTGEKDRAGAMLKELQGVS